jgi:hypothetical protein
MEEEAPDADEKHIEKCHLTCWIVVVLSAIPDALDCKIDEPDVRQRVDDLRGVYRGVIILCSIDLTSRGFAGDTILPLRTNSRSL